MEDNEVEKFFNHYAKFVDGVTSDQSKYVEKYIQVLKDLNGKGCNIPRLDTAITGLTSESGEAMEILKKLKFQGKEWNEETRFHLKRELSDVCWYFMQACLALDYKWSEIIIENIHKLESRYPGGKFDAYYSENREDNDL